MHYLRDFVEAFYILFHAYIELLAGAIVAFGLMLSATWIIVSSIIRRL
jgi:hypothetical protein